MLKTFNKETGKFEWDKPKDYRQPAKPAIQPISAKQQQYKDLLKYLLTKTNAKDIHKIIKESNLTH